MKLDDLDIQFPQEDSETLNLFRRATKDKIKPIERKPYREHCLDSLKRILSAKKIKWVTQMEGDALSYISELGPNIELNDLGWTPLFFVCQIETVALYDDQANEWYLEKVSYDSSEVRASLFEGICQTKPNFMHKDKFGLTAMDYACSFGGFDSVRLFFSQLEDSHNSGNIQDMAFAKRRLLELAMTEFEIGNLSERDMLEIAIQMGAKFDDGLKAQASMVLKVRDSEALKILTDFE